MTDMRSQNKGLLVALRSQKGWLAIWLVEGGWLLVLMVEGEGEGGGGGWRAKGYRMAASQSLY